MKECQITYGLTAVVNNGGKTINVHEMIPNKWGEAQSKSCVENLHNEIFHEAFLVYVWVSHEWVERDTADWGNSFYFHDFGEITIWVSVSSSAKQDRFQGCCED